MVESYFVFFFSSIKISALIVILRDNDVIDIKDPFIFYNKQSTVFGCLDSRGFSFDIYKYIIISCWEFLQTVQAAPLSREFPVKNARC